MFGRRKGKKRSYTGQELFELSRIKSAHVQEFEELLMIFNKALRSFHRHDHYLLKIDVSEQCLCGRLAHHLQNALVGTEYERYDVDCEYNRGMQAKDDGVKKIKWWMCQAGYCCS